MTLGISTEILMMKKVRLVEEGMSYEDLSKKDIFSDEELPTHSFRESLNIRKEKKMLKKAKFLKSRIKELKEFSIDGM